MIDVNSANRKDKGTTGWRSLEVACHPDGKFVLGPNIGRQSVGSQESSAGCLATLPSNMARGEFATWVRNLDVGAPNAQ